MRDARGSSARSSGSSLLCAALWILTPHFLTVSNLLNVVEQTSINAIVAVGMTFVILSGGIDLSVGFDRRAGRRRARHRRCRAGSRWRSRCRWRWRPAPACGLGNGALISWGGLPPFIVTLGTMSIARGAALLFTEGRPISGFDASFRAARDRPRRLRPGAGDRDGDRLRRGALRADAHDVRPLRLRDRRQRGGDAAVGRRRPLSQDDDLRRVGPDERHRRGDADGAAQLGAADRRHQSTSWTRSPRPSSAAPA